MLRAMSAAGDVNGRRSAHSRPEHEHTAVGRRSEREVARECPQCARRFVPVFLPTALAEPVTRIDLRSGSGTLVAGVGCVRVCGAATRGDGRPGHPKQPGHGYPPNRSE